MLSRRSFFASLAAAPVIAAVPSALLAQESSSERALALLKGARPYNIMAGSPLRIGDKFTIAGVYEVDDATETALPWLREFTVKSI